MEAANLARVVIASSVTILPVGESGNNDLSVAPCRRFHEIFLLKSSGNLYFLLLDIIIGLW
jgi:hypothetical protein